MEADDLAAMADQDLIAYRVKLENVLAQPQSEALRYYLPREQLQDQLAAVLVELKVRQETNDVCSPESVGES